MGRRRDVFRALAREQQIREELASQRLPPPESTIPNDLDLYGEIVTENEFQITRRAAEEEFRRRVEQKEAELRAEAERLEAALQLQAAELAKRESTLEEEEYRARAEAEAARQNEALRDQEKILQDAADAERKKRPLIAGLLVGGAVLAFVFG